MKSKLQLLMMLAMVGVAICVEQVIATAVQDLRGQTKIGQEVQGSTKYKAAQSKVQSSTQYKNAQQVKADVKKHVDAQIDINNKIANKKGEDGALSTDPHNEIGFMKYDQERRHDAYQANNGSVAKKAQQVKQSYAQHQGNAAKVAGSYKQNKGSVATSDVQKVQTTVQNSTQYQTAKEQAGLVKNEATEEIDVATSDKATAKAAE